MKHDGTEEFNNNTKHEGENIRKNIWDDMEACGVYGGLKGMENKIIGFSGYLVWKSYGFTEVLLIKQNDGNLVMKVRELTCYTL